MLSRCYRASNTQLGWRMHRSWGLWADRLRVLPWSEVVSHRTVFMVIVCVFVLLCVPVCVTSRVYVHWPSRHRQERNVRVIPQLILQPVQPWANRWAGAFAIWTRWARNSLKLCSEYHLHQSQTLHVIFRGYKYFCFAELIKLLNSCSLKCVCFCVCICCWLLTLSIGALLPAPACESQQLFFPRCSTLQRADLIHQYLPYSV